MKKWTQEEENFLFYSIKKGIPHKEIAEKLYRTHPQKINFLEQIGELDNVLKFSQENNIDITLSN